MLFYFSNDPGKFIRCVSGLIFIVSLPQQVSQSAKLLTGMSWECPVHKRKFLKQRNVYAVGMPVLTPDFDA
jgi:hypothetical protein